MASERCPGQDQRYWRPEDICLIGCPGCGQEIEIWKDEPQRVCRACGREVPNPKLDRSCAAWCPQGKECLESWAGPAGPGAGPETRSK